MDTDLLSRILREARDAAPNPAAAMAIEDLTRDLDPLLTVRETSSDVDEPMDVAAYITDFKALAEHALASENGIDESEGGFSLINPETFGVWIEKLWSLAQ
jgi:hypothetical protein